MRNKLKKEISKRKSLFTIVEDFLKKTALSEGLPTKYWLHIIFIFFLGLFYVANSHYHHKILRKLNILELAVVDSRVSFITLKANCLKNLKQSEIYRKVKEIGLEESKAPPLNLQK